MLLKLIFVDNTEWIKASRQTVILCTSFDKEDLSGDSIKRYLRKCLSPLGRTGNLGTNTPPEMKAQITSNHGSVEI